MSIESLCWECREDARLKIREKGSFVLDLLAELKFLHCHHEPKEKPIKEMTSEERVKKVKQEEEEARKKLVEDAKRILLQYGEKPKCWCNWQSNHIFYYGEGLFKANFCPECGRKL